MTKEEKELEVKERILKAAMDLLNEADDPEQITIREIARRAAVGIGSINYHFQSKENLMNEAVSAFSGEIADQWESTLDRSIADPVERLKSLLRTNAEVGIQNARYLRIMVLHELLHGDFGVPQVILPVLREIFGRDRDEAAIRLMALMLVTSMQVIFIREREFRRYAGLNVFDADERNRMIDFMVDSFVANGGKK